MMKIGLLMMMAVTGQAQEAMVRAKLEIKEAEPWVGQKITMVVEILAPGYFSGSPVFEVPRIPGVLVIPPSESPVLSTEQKGDVSYTVQRHELAVFGQRAGAHDIPTFAVRFGFKRSALDKDAVPQRAMTQPLHFTTKMPPGAEKLGLTTIISARDLKMEEVWQPEPGKTKAKAGDAFVRTITFSAPDVPGMAFPPFPAREMDGIGLYPKPPVVLDKSERGEMHGERKDTVSYQCKRPGHFVIPAARFTWWDLEAKQLKTVDFPARELDVAPNPALAAAASETEAVSVRSSSWVIFCEIVAVILALGLGGWWGRERVKRATKQVVDFFRPVHLQPLNPAERER